MRGSGEAAGQVTPGTVLLAHLAGSDFTKDVVGAWTELHADLAATLKDGGLEVFPSRGDDFMAPARGSDAAGRAVTAALALVRTVAEWNRPRRVLGSPWGSRSSRWRPAGSGSAVRVGMRRPPPAVRCRWRRECWSSGRTGPAVHRRSDPAAGGGAVCRCAQRSARGYGQRLGASTGVGPGGDGFPYFVEKQETPRKGQGKATHGKVEVRATPSTSSGSPRSAA